MCRENEKKWKEKNEQQQKQHWISLSATGIVHKRAYINLFWLDSEQKIGWISARF